MRARVTRANFRIREGLLEKLSAVSLLVKAQR
jgi:hypothetical protein